MLLVRQVQEPEEKEEHDTKGGEGHAQLSRDGICTWRDSKH